MSSWEMQGEDSAKSEPLWRWIAVLGGAGLALYLGLSLWVVGRQLGPSLKIELARTWVPGSATPLRVELRDEDGRSATIADSGVSLRLRAPGRAPVKLQRLPVYEMRRGKGGTRAQAMVSVPTDWPEGQSELLLSLSQEDGAALERSCPVQVSSQPSPKRSAQALAEAQFVRDADPSDPQPKGYLIELRPADLLRASLPQKLWLRLCDEQGKALQGHVEVDWVAGDFKAAAPFADHPKRILSQAIPRAGLLSFSGTLSSEQLGVQVQVWNKLEDKLKGKPPLAKRKILLRAFPGSSTLRARAKSEPDGLFLQTQYLSLVSSRRASIDVFDQDGRWVAMVDPPSWPAQSWVSHPMQAWPKGLLSLEAYPGVPKVQPSIAGAMVWHGASGEPTAKELQSMVQATKARLSRWPKTEQGPTKRYLEGLVKREWTPQERAQLMTWLTDTLPPGRFAAPLVHHTRSEAERELKDFRARWKLRLRVLLWGGYALYAMMVTVLFARQRRQRVAQLTHELSSEFAPALSQGAGLWLRVAGVVLVATLCVWLLSKLMESLV